MPNSETLILTRSELEKLATMNDVIAAVEGAFKAHGEGKVVMPAKISLNFAAAYPGAQYDAFINAMPAYVVPAGAGGIKWVSVFEKASERGLPRVSAVLILNDPDTGAVKAILEAGWITAARTGAATAVGAKYLAKKDAGVIAIIGAGVQGEYQLQALACVLKVREVRIYDVREAASEAYAAKMSRELRLSIAVAHSAREAVQGADVVVAATSARQPFVDAEWLAEGCFICALGSHEEIYDNVVQTAKKIVVDNLEQAKHRGSLAKKMERGVLAENDIYAELAEIVVGRKPGREGSERILFCPIGMGSEDVATGAMLYERARKKGLGLKIDLLR
jgi:alanine dehydrogenase